MSNATVTIPLDELDAMRKATSEYVAEITKLKAELLAGKMEATGDELQKIMAMCRSSMRIVGYAVANLSPEFSKKWPFAELRIVAEGIVALPDCNPHDAEFAFELTKFATECETWEGRRKAQGERYVPPPLPEVPIKPVSSSLIDLANQVDRELLEKS